MRDPKIYNTWSDEETQTFLARQTTGRLGTMGEGVIPTSFPCGRS